MRNLPPQRPIQPPRPRPPGVPTRFVEEVGTIAYLRQHWQDDVQCQLGWSYHNAMSVLTQSMVLDDWTLGGDAKSYPLEQFPNRCTTGTCGQPVPEKADRMILHRRLYRTPDGSLISANDLKPGDLFFMRNHFYDHCPYGWTNCDGFHLHVVLPNGSEWDIDSRASNCTKKDDYEHRCWIRHGDPRTEPVHVDKQGNTCAAGAGSIVSGNFHGFLRMGRIESC
jgi:hypothetical protein